MKTTPVYLTKDQKDLLVRLCRMYLHEHDSLMDRRITLGDEEGMAVLRRGRKKVSTLMDSVAGQRELPLTPLMSDSGDVVVRVHDAREAFPWLPHEAIAERFATERPEGDEVMPWRDLLFCLKAHEEGNSFEDYEYEDVTWCDVCGEPLMPDDEVYREAVTGHFLCGDHATMVGDEYVRWLVWHKQ